MILLIILFCLSISGSWYCGKKSKNTARSVLIRRDFVRWHDFFLLLTLFFLILIAGRIEYIF